MADVIRAALVRDEESTLQLAVEVRTNSLIVYGTPAELDVVEPVIAELDAQLRPGMEQARGPRQGHDRLLFYWLATGPDFTTEKPIPQQLESVVKELERLGLDNLQLVSRSLAAFNGDYVSISTAVEVPDRAFNLNFEGRFAEAQSLRLEVMASELAPESPGRERRRSKSCSLNTMITAPRDHFVVLGVTGLGDLENAFVIQIQSDEPAEGGEEPRPNRTEK